MKRVKEKIQFKLLTLCLLSLGEGIKGRGLFLFLFLFLLFFFSLPFGEGWGGASSFAQNYPIQITTQLVQPFSGFIPDYSTPGNQNLKLLVVFTDFTKPSYNIKLKLQITGQGITIQSKSYYYSGPITLQPGTPIEISGNDLSGLLNSTNLDFSGITPQKYQTNSLPEGYYNICFTAYDYNNPIPIQVSNQSCDFGWMVLSDPPYLNLPICGSTTTVNTPQNMMFQWTAMNMNSPNSANTTFYDFDLYEVRPSTQSPGNIIQTLPPIYQVTTPFTFVNYGITEPQLYYGMQYVWRVRARDQSNRDLFKNQGYSQLCTFTYGSVLSQIDSNSIKLTLQGTALTYRLAKYTWDSLSIFLSYKLEYRKVGTPNWFPINTSLCRSLVNNLEPENTYEARVKGVFSEGAGPWSNVVTITTPAKPIIACGQSGIPPLAANFVPLTTGKTSQVWNIGQFDMLVTQLDNPNNPTGKYSGYGKIVIPFLLIMNLRGKFTNITVNEAMEVVEGKVEIVTDGQRGAGIINFDTVFGNINDAFHNFFETGDTSVYINNLQEVCQQIQETGDTNLVNNFNSIFSNGSPPSPLFCSTNDNAYHSYLSIHPNAIANSQTNFNNIGNLGWNGITPDLITNNNLQSSITIDGKIYNFSTIYNSLKILKLKIKHLYDNNLLTSEEILIMNLPILMWRLDYKYGAVMMLHWLEGSGSSIKLPYGFFTSVIRLNNADVINVSKLNSALWGSYIDEGAGGNNANSETYLYNTDIGTIYTAYNQAKQYFKTIPLNQPVLFGDFNNFSTTITSTNIKSNFVKTYELGSALGDKDDVGIALGRFSIRAYIKANVERSLELGYDMAKVELLEAATRYVDQYEFKDDGLNNLYSQPLGCWKNDIVNPDVKFGTLLTNYFCIQNADFISIQGKLGNLKPDFLIYSDIKTHTLNNENIIRFILPN